MANHLDKETFGLSWHVFAFYAPALVITHVMMLRSLFRHAARQDRHRGPLAA
jgi:hypothetical protein